MDIYEGQQQWWLLSLDTVAMLTEGGWLAPYSQSLSVIATFSFLGDDQGRFLLHSREHGQ